MSEKSNPNDGTYLLDTWAGNDLDEGSVLRHLVPAIPFSEDHIKSHHDDDNILTFLTLGRQMILLRAPC